MEHALTAAGPGTVAATAVLAGDQVSRGQTLLSVTSNAPDAVDASATDEGA